MYLPISYKIQYDTDIFPFRKYVSEMLEVSELETIHTLEKYELFNREKDQSTVWHKKYYESFNEKMSKLYEEFILTLKGMFEYDQIIYQKIPTFRVQLGDGNLGVGEWHKDSIYNHGTTEVNFWLPFTDTNDKNSVWIESKEDKGDFRPHKVRYGEILVFSGANLKHGNQINDSGKTRVSMDFRLVSVDKFKPSKKTTMSSKKVFDLGGYFDIL